MELLFSPGDICPYTVIDIVATGPYNIDYYGRQDSLGQSLTRY